MAKKFFYVCAGLFLLAGVYAMGARSAGAQVGTAVNGFLTTNPCGAQEFWVITSNGDVFKRHWSCSGFVSAAQYVENYWGGATPAKLETWGQVKARYR